MNDKKLFRLKKAAIPFFNKKYATHILSLETWEHYHIDENALEEVEAVYITYGIKKSNSSSDLSGWSDDTTAIHFTINLTGVSHEQHRYIIDPLHIISIMQTIQDVLNDKINNE